ncbi:MAG: hypothetical protein JNL58_22530 [Planctomyces sp.]|nr:hypothetical protein [Planctomyces sp.]
MFAKRLDAARDAINQLPVNHRIKPIASLLLVLWIICPLLIIFPPVYLLTESVCDMHACMGRKRPVQEVSVDQLHYADSEVGDHVLIRDYEFPKSLITEIRPGTEVNAPLYTPQQPMDAPDQLLFLEPGPSRGHYRNIYISLPASLVSAAVKARTETGEVPLLDAVIVRKDSKSFQLTESSTAMTYTEIMLARTGFVLMILVGLGVAVLIRKLTRVHQRLAASGSADGNSLADSESRLCSLKNRTISDGAS